MLESPPDIRHENGELFSKVNIRQDDDLIRDIVVKLISATLSFLIFTNVKKKYIFL